jgi:hypothetical protein
MDTLQDDLKYTIGCIVPQLKYVNKYYYDLLPKIDNEKYSFLELNDIPITIDVLHNDEHFNLEVKEHPVFLLKKKCHNLNTIKTFTDIHEILWDTVNMILYNKKLLEIAIKWDIFKYVFNLHLNNKRLLKKLNWNESFTGSLYMCMYH